MKLGPAQISTTCTSFIYLLLLHFPLLFLLLKNDTVVQINDLQSHFYLPHFTNMQVEKENPKFYPNKRTDYYLINYCCTNTIPKDFSPSFHISYFGSFFSHLRTRDLLTVIFQNKNDAANQCFWNASSWKGKAAMNTLHEGNVILLLSVYAYS